MDGNLLWQECTFKDTLYNNISKCVGFLLFFFFFKVQSATSCHSCACANSNSWDKADEDDIKLVNIPVTTPENLYLMGKS